MKKLLPDLANPECFLFLPQIQVAVGPICSEIEPKSLSAKASKNTAGIDPRDVLLAGKLYSKDCIRVIWEDLYWLVQGQRIGYVLES